MVRVKVSLNRDVSKCCINTLNSSGRGNLPVCESNAFLFTQPESHSKKLTLDLQMEHLTFQKTLHFPNPLEAMS